MLALLGDREFINKDKGIKINFFEKETRPCIPKGPVKLALRTGAKIIPGFVIRDKRNHHTIIFKEPIEISRTGDEKEDSRRTMENFFAVFEEIVKKYPSQWFVFYPLWEEI